MLKKLLLIFLATAALASCSHESSQQHWRFALEEIKGSVQDAYAQRFKQLVEERSGGKVKVSIYPYGTLGTSAQMTEQVQNGTMQFAFASPGHLGSVIPEAQIFSLHFLFSEDDEVNRQILTRTPEVHDLLSQAYRDKGLDLLAIVPEGWMVWTGNRPLRTLKDFKGFKMRTMVSPLLLDAYKAYGADPTPMPYSEVYSGLQLNMIDGQVNPVFAIEEMSFYEVQSDMTFARHLPFVSTVIVNPDFLAGLPDDEQKMLSEVKSELDDYIFKVQKRYNAERLKKIKQVSDIKIIKLTEKERDAFRRASLPVRHKYVELAGPRGKKLLQAVLKARDGPEGSQPALKPGPRRSAATPAR